MSKDTSKTQTREEALESVEQQATLKSRLMTPKGAAVALGVTATVVGIGYGVHKYRQSKAASEEVVPQEEAAQ